MKRKRKILHYLKFIQTYTYRKGTVAADQLRWGPGHHGKNEQDGVFIPGFMLKLGFGAELLEDVLWAPVGKSSGKITSALPLPVVGEKTHRLRK